ncbi:MAG: NHLP bacteriocin system secretion protein [Arcobacteraceae bacterium]|nr:NHLP bacteriocin system secretion protein [Arcobacteraceae bacterium]
MAQEIFRKSALAKLSSPEQLDTLVKQVSSKGWLALLTFGLIIAFTVVWGFYGTITTKVNGTGLIMKLSGMSNIYSTTTGMISELYIEVGDEIEKDQIIAKVLHKREQLTIKTKEDTLLKLQEKKEESSKIGQNDLRLNFSIFKKQKDEIKLQIAMTKKRYKEIGLKINSQTELYSKGLITKENLTNTQNNLEKTDMELTNLINSLSVKNIEAFQKKRALENELSQFEQRIIDAKRELRQLRQNLILESNIKSNFSGKIMELNVAQGTVVGGGWHIAIVENSSNTNGVGDNLRAVFFIPALKGKLVQNDMMAQISPSNIKKQEYGFIEGKVDFVSEFPASSKAIMNIIKNEDLAQSFVQNGSPIIVYATLQKDNNTFSKLKWSSSKGPKVYITSGTICQVQVAVKKQKPISFVIPYLENKLGL